MGKQRFAGQEGSVTVVDSTTGDALLADISVESFNVHLPFDVTKKDFIGEVGPDFREFSDGYEVELKVEHNDAAQTVDFINAIVAKARSESLDEFAASLKYVSPDGGAFRVILQDIHWEGPPLELAGRKEFLASTLKGKGKVFKVQLAS